jgi:hypothetical protein
MVIDHGEEYKMTVCEKSHDVPNSEEHSRRESAFIFVVWEVPQNTQRGIPSRCLDLLKIYWIQKCHEEISGTVSSGPGLEDRSEGVHTVIPLRDFLDSTEE